MTIKIDQNPVTSEGLASLASDEPGGKPSLNFLINSPVFISHTKISSKPDVITCPDEVLFVGGNQIMFDLDDMTPKEWDCS
ncbi:hypothetical protein WICMUC_002764 [Wickerhamomyces mucosus]|uniref:Uncharacterized protein n=1 Tax=Wickerhamomyces mucosus TaxID=1378264 RepID=A0A9P8PPT3_9ASCO|nr:hypothetical protein WICMUC_002764 [Wickerhamomyces mucosus]